MTTGTAATTASTSAAPKHGRAAMAFVLVTVVLDVLALGLVIPVLPKLVEGFMHGDTARAARTFGVFGTAWALMQLVFSPVMGALSDRVGRRPVILLSCLGLGLDYVLMAVAPTVTWLFVGRVISGITAASFSTAAAYIADVTPPEKRAGSFGAIGAAFGVGFVLGPALGGLLGGMNPRLPFWVAACLALANVTYGAFVLPESLPADRRAPFSWKRANPLSALTLLGSHAELMGLSFVTFLYQLAHQVLQTVFVLYTGHRYGWGPGAVGGVLAAVGLGNIVVQGGLVRPAVARFGERAIMLTGLGAGGLGFVVMGVAPTGHAFWAGVPLLAVMGSFGPAAQGRMTRRIGPSDQGRLQGATSSVMGIAGLMGPGLFTTVFAHTLDTAPGSAFFVSAALLSLAALLAGWVSSARVAADPH